jgi:hypothetical protein
MENKPTLLYYFTHQFLRDLVQNKYAFFDAVVRLGGNTFSSVLRQTFETLKRYDLAETDVSLTDADFMTTMASLGENKIPMLVIKLPQPRNTTEASHIAVVLGSMPVRYFTLELHIPNETEKQINPNAESHYILCEWVNKEHRVLNKRWPEADAAKFSGAIETVLFSNLPN